MDHLINLLPDNIANQIAAGEVIQRPASVIKELVENAIDANATEVSIEIKDAGRTLIQVIDNGKGMAPTDARMAFERHATSKIKCVDDLFALTTMGFRGEALASIAAVSQVQLQTRTIDSEIGVKVELEASKVISTEQVVCPVGANFAIRNLFFNVPARRKFLKSNETEFKHIVKETQHIAIVHNDISFTLRHNDQLTFSLTPTDSKQRIIDIFGRRLRDVLIPLNAETPILRISGYIGRASSSRKRGTLQYFYVNDRYMKHPQFHRSILNAYEGMIPSGEQPEYFIFMHVEPSTIDVNIHPTKTEIKFEAESDISKILYSITREALMKGASIPTLDFEEKIVDIPPFKSLQTEEMTEPEIITPDETDTLLLDDPDVTAIPEEFDLPDMNDWDTFYQNFESNRKAKSSNPISTTPNSGVVTRVRPSSINSLQNALIDDEETKIEGPLSSTNKQEPPSSDKIDESNVLVVGHYVITSDHDDIKLVHIPRARMRIIYNNYRSMVDNNSMISRRLIFPELIDLGINEKMRLEQNLSKLSRLGFDISSMGGNAYAINALPDGISSNNMDVLISELLDECNDKNISTEELFYDKLTLSLTHRRLKSEGTAISAKEAVSLLSDLEHTEDNILTPDGKLIVSIITQKELIKRFS